ncbi:MAG: cellulase family glycosylhydrolase [Pelomonas sp.]|nr:cellulase family glycosylhydrolase [Roseateles sp.]
MTSTRRDWLRQTSLATGAGLLLPQAFSATPEPPRMIELDIARAEHPVDRFFDHCVGADYPGTTQRDDCQAQLKTAVDELGFRYLRMHGIFHDVLHTVRRAADGTLTFDFSGVAKLYDALLAKRIRPLVELGFTPAALASSAQTIFYWAGNTSHPQPEGWERLLRAFVAFVRGRYGVEEVRHWYFEVWNEPNLAGFWEGADQAAYFDLYTRSARVLKSIDPALKVGGPATAGAAWVAELLAHVKAHDVPIDFVSTHSYGVDGGFLDEKGEQDTKLSASPDAIVGDVRRVRAQIEASHRPGLPLFFTEWSTSYNPRDKVHDAYQSAAWILARLKACQGLAQSMSYWTYTDLFEEPGPPDRAFHGGFGLMTRDGLRKPAWFAYRYLQALRGREIPCADAAVWASVDDAGTNVEALLWDQRPVAMGAQSNRDFFGKPRPSVEVPVARLALKNLPAGRYRLAVHRCGYRANDAYTVYLEMGAPKDLDAAALAKLQALTADAPEQQRDIEVGADGRATIELTLREHDVLRVSVRRL